jgi:hypothetical protein
MWKPTQVKLRQSKILTGSKILKQHFNENIQSITRDNFAVISNRGDTVNPLKHAMKLVKPTWCNVILMAQNSGIYKGSQHKKQTDVNNGHS